MKTITVLCVSVASIALFMVASFVFNRAERKLSPKEPLRWAFVNDQTPEHLKPDRVKMAGIERLNLDGHLYYYKSADTHRSGGINGPLAVSNPLLIHAAGCTNHAPSVQAEAPIGRYLRGGEPNFIQGTIGAEDLPMTGQPAIHVAPTPPGYWKSTPHIGLGPAVTNLLEIPIKTSDIVIGVHGVLIPGGVPIPKRNLGTFHDGVSETIYRTPCEHEPSTFQFTDGSMKCVKCGNQIKVVYR